MAASIPGVMLFEHDDLLHLHSEPVAGRPAFDAATLVALIQEVGGGGWFVADDVLATAVRRCYSESAVIEMQLGARRPATVTVEIAPDQMTASVVLAPVDGGERIALAEVLGALLKAGVKHGIDQPALAAACQSGLPQRVTAALGTPPQAGVNSSFEVLTEDHRERAPKVNELGMIDFREHGEVPVVDVGQPLMRRIPATAGIPGTDVCGRALPAEPGKDEPFATPCPGAKPDAADPNLLRASAKGQPVRLGNAVVVEQVFKVREVNMASGNISFDGTVQVSGDVAPGMKVHASGDIVVNGTVEGGILEAGGDIRIQGGAIAHAQLKAGGSVAARFVETSTVHAGLAIVVDDMVSHSDLQAGAQISVGAKSRQRGRLVGGSARAKMRISVPVLGVASGGRTRVQVGRDPELEARKVALAHEIELHKAEAEKLEKLVQFLTRGGDPKGLLPRARPAWQHALQVWAQSLQQKDELEHQLAAFLDARVEVTAGVAGEVELVIGHKHHLLESEYPAGYFSMQPDGTVIYTDSAQGLHPVN